MTQADVHTKEDADDSLPYLLAIAAFDGDVQPAQLSPRRIEKPDVQGLRESGRQVVRLEDKLSGWQ